MTNRVLVVGNFGIRTGQLDGQTVKTRTLFESLCTHEDVQTERLDVSVCGALSVFPLLGKLVHVSHVIFLPGIKQLLVLSPILLILKRVLGYKVHYVVVGGWLTEKIRNPIVRYLVSQFDSVGCELESMRRVLAEVNENACVLPNFRPDETEAGSHIELTRGGSIKLVYFSRVMREKGIFEAIDLAERMHGDTGNITLDIYGQICFRSAADARLFNERVEADLPFVNYRGAVSPAEIQGVLSAYDVLVFPTRYPGEGFPGCLVDAMRAGLAIICTDWKYNAEIVSENSCGYVIDGDFCAGAARIIAGFLNDPSILKAAKVRSRASAKRFCQSVFLDWSRQWICASH